jgi:hypothetical protein
MTAYVIYCSLRSSYDLSDEERMWKVTVISYLKPITQKCLRKVWKSRIIWIVLPFCTTCKYRCVQSWFELSLWFVVNTDYSFGLFATFGSAFATFRRRLFPILSGQKLNSRLDNIKHTQRHQQYCDFFPSFLWRHNATFGAWLCMVLKLGRFGQ